MAGDLSSFSERLLRFDPGALIRLRDGRAWGRLPWDVLVCVPYACTGDHVISAVSREPRDPEWRVPLPPEGRTVEVLPASAVSDAALAAAKTVREIGSVSRAVRDALLDHPVITGTSDADGSAFVVPQRLVQGIVRMRLLSAGTVGVLVAGPWTGLGTPLGEAWYRPSSGLTVRPLR